MIDSMTLAAGGLDAINSGPILKTASFIIIAPLVGMLMAFIMSLWFLISFRKDILPKIVSIVILAVEYNFQEIGFIV